MPAVHWKRQAFNDLVRIGRSVATNCAVNADKLVGQLQVNIAALASYPKLGRVGRKPGMRELVVHGHYIVIHSVTASAVVIIRVKHTARRWP